MRHGIGRARLHGVLEAMADDQGLSAIRGVLATPGVACGIGGKQYFGEMYAHRGVDGEKWRCSITFLGGIGWPSPVAASRIGVIREYVCRSALARIARSVGDAHRSA